MRVSPVTALIVPLKFADDKVTNTKQLWQAKCVIRLKSRFKTSNYDLMYLGLEVSNHSYTGKKFLCVKCVKNYILVSSSLSFDTI